MAACRPELNEAQDVVLCKYCEQSSDELYHCTDCGDNMCPKCHKDRSSYFFFVTFFSKTFQLISMELSELMYDNICKKITQDLFSVVTAVPRY